MPTMQGGSDVPRAQERPAPRATPGPAEAHREPHREPHRDKPERDGPNIVVKIAVVTFLVVFAAMAVSKVEAWPFTAWRLFSERRGPVSVAPRPYAVSSTGTETAINLGALPVAYRQVNRLLVKFGSYSEKERRDLCDGLAEGERNAGHDLAGIRIYRVTSHSHIKDGEPVTRSTRKLLYTCPDLGNA
jgi:hypothetical protein